MISLETLKYIRNNFFNWRNKGKHTHRRIGEPNTFALNLCQSRFNFTKSFNDKKELCLYALMGLFYENCQNVESAGACNWKFKSNVTLNSKYVLHSKPECMCVYE